MRRFLSTTGILGLLLIIMGVASTSHVATAAKPQPPSPPRFVDNGDGTITDNQTGLMWEQKTGPVGDFIDCTTPTICAEPTNVNNRYAWTSLVGGFAADGPLFTDFLAKMNCTLSQTGRCPVSGRYRDWRIPNVSELRTIWDCSFRDDSTTPPTPCIDPIFGPTWAGVYSSSSSAGSLLSSDFLGYHFHGFPTTLWAKDIALSARAVRGGS